MNLVSRSLLAALFFAPAAGSEDVKEITVLARAWEFTPGVIHVQPGDTVRFRVRSEDIKHGFAINELGLNLQLAAGREARSPDLKIGLTPGKYAIHCSTFCGLGHSMMKATLVVGEPPADLAALAPWIASGIALAAAGSFAARRRRS